MIDGKVLKFGYGDIAIDSDALAQKISFQQFETPMKCGEDVPKDMKYIGEEIILQISYEEYCELIEQLNNVLKEFVSVDSYIANKIAIFGDLFTNSRACDESSNTTIESFSISSI